MEEICGARLTYNYLRIGGVGYDITPETCGRITEFLDHFELIVDEYENAGSLGLQFGWQTAVKC